jgi:hypothetical protein
MNVMRVIDPQRLNLYAYGRNNPLVYTDPSGKDIVADTGNQKPIRAALIEIARHPGGREMLTKLDKLTVRIQLNNGEAKGGKGYGSITGSFMRQKDDSGHVMDATGGPINITLDFKLAASDRDLNKSLENMGKWAAREDVPSSDAELTGHELAHGEDKIFELNDNEDNPHPGRIRDILPQKPDMTRKEAEKFVDDILNPNSGNQKQQPSTPQLPCTNDKDKPCPK